MAKSTARKNQTEDLFNALAESATPVDKKKESSRKKEKPQLDLNENEEQIFETFCASDVIFKMAEGKQKAAKAQIIPVLRRKLLQKWLEQGHKTENPVVFTGKARANFVAREILKIELPEREDGTPGTVKDRLLDVGFSEEEAEGIYSREFTETTEMNFRPLNDLRNGTQDEQQVVQKLLKLVLKNFSVEEQRMLLRRQTKVEVQDGFLDRAVSHAGGSIEKLDALLSVIAPQWVLSHMTYSQGDLRQAMAELTGGEVAASKVQEFHSADGEWKAVAQDNEAFLYRDEKQLGVKKCESNDHAVSTCKKWLRDPEYRARSIADMTGK